MACLVYLVAAVLGVLGLMYVILFVPWVVFLMHHWWVMIVIFVLLHAVNWLSARWKELKGV